MSTSHLFAALHAYNLSQQPSVQIPVSQCSSYNPKKPQSWSCFEDHQGNQQSSGTIVICIHTPPTKLCEWDSKGSFIHPLLQPWFCLQHLAINRNVTVCCHLPSSSATEQCYLANPHHFQAKSAPGLEGKRPAGVTMGCSFSRYECPKWKVKVYSEHFPSSSYSLFHISNYPDYGITDHHHLQNQGNFQPLKIYPKGWKQHKAALLKYWTSAGMAWQMGNRWQCHILAK